ncbi:MAG: hypothetical protein J5554_08570 [Paludibacteraceae bacterium]|nr:hypothetical protein [Paludibacteraceae bacterium]
MQTTIMTQDLCMRFLVWSYYYHGIQPEKEKSFSEYGIFKESDCQRLDELKDSLFLCFEAESIHRACEQFYRARVLHEPCPYSQADLDRMFASEVNHRQTDNR